MKAAVQKLTLPAGRRLLAVSDIHGNLPYFRGLLDKCRFTENDILFILGDMVEKGRYSLDTLRFIMELGKTHTIYPLCGNCDGWHRLFSPTHPLSDEMLLRHLTKAHYWGTGPGLVGQMCAEAGIDVDGHSDMGALKRTLASLYPAEFEYLSSLPTIIDAGPYVFVHGGVPSLENMEELDSGLCKKNDCFMRQGLRFDRWVIVGHWPVMLYGEDRVCANPIIDRKSRIISIDGGCVLKDDGQLNALIIPEAGSEDFSHIAYDPFPVCRVLTAQEGGARSYYIRWGDNHVRVLDRGPEFSRCRHIRTGYEMDVLTKYLWGDGAECRCNDSTDYVLPLSPGDAVSVVETTSRGWLVKHNGVSGWYYGRLSDD